MNSRAGLGSARLRLNTIMPNAIQMTAQLSDRHR
jgi:hypothetical protein